MYAIISIDGRQERIEPGTKLEIGRIDSSEGESIALDDTVLLYHDGNESTVGTPTVPGAKVHAEVLRHHRGKKLTVFKMKQRNRYRCKNGHRQALSTIKVTDITRD